MEHKTNTPEKPKIRTEFEYSQAFWATLNNSVDRNVPLMERYFDMDKIYGDMMPVSPIEFETSTDHIEIDTEVIETLDAFREITIEDNKEIAFLLFGLKDLETGSIMLNKVGLSRMSSSMQAEFSDAQNKQLMEKVNFFKSNAQECKEAGYLPIVCHGHSHPKIGIAYNCFSKKDLITCVELQDICDNFVGKEDVVEVIGVLVTPCGDFNFINHNKDENKFEKYEKLTDVQGNHISAYEQPKNYIAK